jgi:hypothetical protein
MLGEIYAAAGDHAAAVRVLADLQQEAARRYVCPHEVAALQAALGDKDAAFASLLKVLEVRSAASPS